METIKLDAGHDTNGNPRRVFVVIKNNVILATYDDYRGSASISNPEHKAAYKGLTFATTAQERRELLTIGG